MIFLTHLYKGISLLFFQHPFYSSFMQWFCAGVLHLCEQTCFLFHPLATTWPTPLPGGQMDDSDFAQVLPDLPPWKLHKRSSITVRSLRFPLLGELRIFSKIGIYHTQDFHFLYRESLLTGDIFDPLLWRDLPSVFSAFKLPYVFCSESAQVCCTAERRRASHFNLLLPFQPHHPVSGGQMDAS